METPGLIVNDQPGQREHGKGGAGSRTAWVEGTRLHKRGSASAEDGQVPPQTPEGILDAAGGCSPFSRGLSHHEAGRVLTVALVIEKPGYPVTLTGGTMQMAIGSS